MLLDALKLLAIILSIKWKFSKSWSFDDEESASS